MPASHERNPIALRLLTRAIVCSLLLVVSAAPAIAQKKEDVGFAKGDSVVIGVPVPLLRASLSGSYTLKLDADVRSQDGVIEIYDSAGGTWRSDWRSLGFPPAGRYDVHKVAKVYRYTHKAKFWEVTINTPTQGDFRIFVPEDQPGAARGVIAPIGSADSVIQASYAAISARVFVGPLEVFSESERTALLTYAHMTAVGSALGSEIFKGNTYLVIWLPGDGSTWNDLQVTRSQRVGRIINDQLALLKSFAAVVLPHGVIHGLKLQQRSRHGTAPYYTDSKSEVVEAYFPLDAIVAFANQDITSQALVDRSIILVDGNRVEVDLSTQ